MHKIEIDIENVSKIEGHTNMHVKIEDGKVKECKLEIDENQRFYKKAAEGLDYKMLPVKMSRICGTCSAAHTLCSIEAVEKALGIRVSEQTMKLRNLLMNAGHLRDHAMHLYFFCLPDVFHKESIFDFQGELHEWTHDGLDVKEAGNFLSTIIGGRSVHPPFAIVGGFTQFPNKNQIKEAITQLQSVREKIIKIVDVFYNYKKDFNRDTNYVALFNDNYNYLKGVIKTSKGTEIPEEDFGKHYEKVVLPYSTAHAVKWESKDYMVGALARINLNKGNLHKNTKKDLKIYLKKFPSNCIFDNNLAQAIEMLHNVDNSIDILQGLQKNIKIEKPVDVKVKAGNGIGVVEAPRGTLYYNISLDSKGIVTKADLCIPTQQNIINLEKDIAKHVEELLIKKKSKEEISLSVEEVIRAYDPCMSCATHFLKINWGD
jgi:sulfhydrogenase subunit alpha